ncbi:MAG: hypothetical protein K2G17_08110, partial [Duncaniella sp.]|nr:hypothetical protein [Duncaniella sp.]
SLAALAYITTVQHRLNSGYIYIRYLLPLIFCPIHQIRPYTLRTIAEFTIKAVIKPGQAQITMNIISIAQRTIPIMVVRF